MRKVIKNLFIVVVFFYLCCHSVPLKLIAPECYRMDLTLAPVIFLCVHYFKWDDRIVVAIVLRQLLLLVFGNHDTRIYWHVLIVFSDMIMDMLLMVAAWLITSDILVNERKKIVGLSLIAYSFIGVVLNIIYHLLI